MPPGSDKAVSVDAGQLELMRQIAESAAESTARKLREELRDEWREEARILREEVKRTIRDEIKHYHGDMTPTEHAIQHNRMSRLLDFTDNIQQSVWKATVSFVVRWGLVIMLGAYVAQDLIKVPAG